MLAKVFKVITICGDWDYDQRDLPDGCELIGFSEIPFNKISKNDVFIFNHAPSDLLNILKTFLFTRARMILVVHGELDRVGSSSFKRLVKKLFYRSLAVFFESRGRIVCIQDKVKLSYGFSESAVSIEPFYVDPGYENNSILPDRFILVANSFRREHFDKNLPMLIKDLGFNVDLVGRDNEEFKSTFNVITPINQVGYFGELSKGGVYLNVLTPPEAPYNLSLLDAIGVGLPIVEVARSDSVIQTPIASVSDLSNVTKGCVEGWLKQANIYTDDNKEIFSNRFSITRFKKMWEEVVDFDIC